MPTRSGLDYHNIHPDWFVCSYCYQAAPYIPGITQYQGMVKKQVMVRIDDSDDFVPIQETTSIWTEPHCWACNRRIKGYMLYWPPIPRYKYA